MRKLYYDCPLQAAYMAKEFGVILAFKTTIYASPFGIGAEKELAAYRNYEQFNPWRIIKWKKPKDIINAPRDYGGAGRDGKFYVYPDSLPIFEPRKGDFVRDGELGGVLQESGEILCTDGAATMSCEMCDEINYILQRNGKPFFMPLVADE